MKELERLTEAMFKIVDKSSDREEDIPNAINAGQVLLDAICAGRYPLGKDDADEFRTKLGRLESKVKELVDSVYGPPPDGPVDSGSGNDLKAPRTS